MSSPSFLSDGSTPRRTDQRWTILQKILGATIDGGGGGGGGGVPTTRLVTAGSGLTGGGDLSANRTFDIVAADGTIIVNANSIQVGTVPFSQISGAPATIVNSSWFTFVGGEVDAATNGTELVTAYAAAKLLTPGGLALGASNRHTIVLLPGVYSVADGALVLDTEFIDLVGLSRNSGSEVFVSPLIDHGDTVITSTGHTLGQTANNVTIANVCLRTSSATKYAWNLTTVTNAAMRMLNVLIVNTNAMTTASMPGAVTLEGKYFDVRAWNQGSFGYSNTSICSGIFLRVKCGAFSFGTALGSGSVASGTFTDCEADGASFGTNGTASGLFVRCKYIAIDTTSSPMFGGAGLASGVFEDCQANGQDGSFGNTASGTFRRCVSNRAGIASGGSFGSGTTGLASGLFFQCEGGNNSFGGSNNATGRTFSGQAYQCKALANSFGSGSTTAGVMSGLLKECKMIGKLNATVSGRVEGMDIIVSNANETAVMVTTGAIICRCTLVGNGTGFSVDAAGAVSVAIYLCACNLGFGVNVTNLITTPYIVNDTDIA